MPGICYIVATPIGNLGDITYRAVEILGSVGMIAAEDTRTSSVLLNHYGIRTRLLSFNARNESARINQILAELNGGIDIAVITDAGTPAISDPGTRLVNACHNHGIRVEPIPGPSAGVAALSAAGLPTDKFWFEGFLPQKKGRQTRLKALANIDGTIVLYESPHRIRKTLEQVAEFIGPERICVVARELTKKFEEIIRGNPVEIVSYLEQKPVKGEIVLLIAPENFYLKESE